MDKQGHAELGVKHMWEAEVNYGRCRQIEFRELGESQVESIVNPHHQEPGED